MHLEPIGIFSKGDKVAQMCLHSRQLMFSQYYAMDLNKSPLEWTPATLSLQSIFCRSRTELILFSQLALTTFLSSSPSCQERIPRCYQVPNSGLVGEGMTQSYIDNSSGLWILLTSCHSHDSKSAAISSWLNTSIQTQWTQWARSTLVQDEMKPCSGWERRNRGLA